MHIKTKVLDRLFGAAFDAFVREEAPGLLMDVHEQNSCGRLAIHLDREVQRAGLKGYFVDTEYNRKQDARVKTVIDDELQVIRIRCDLILHSRGDIPIQDNLIAVEMKKAGRPAQEREADMKRLMLMTRRTFDGIWSTGDGIPPEHVCGYGVGIFIEVASSVHRITLSYFKDGALTKDRVVSF